MWVARLKGERLRGRFAFMRWSRVVVVFLASLLCLGAAEPQITLIKKVGNKTVTCWHTGLFSDLNDCGVRADWYSYVFVGSIASVEPADHGEKKLEVRPEEIFHGNPPTPLTVFTSQAACLPKLKVGARWLFYLRKEKGKPVVLDYYGNDSLPIADAKKQLETLRRLETIGDRGILRGEVRRGDMGDGKPVADAVVTARGGPGHRKYVTRTNTGGNYEFPPLPAGAYTISVHPIGSFRPDNASLDVHPGGCWDLTLRQLPHARIAGYLRYADGSPVVGAQVLLIDVAKSVWSTLHVDARGRYQFDSLEAGRYVVGICLPRRRCLDGSGSGPPPAASLYYPGVTSRSAAVPITLRTDQKRDSINFVIPTK